MTETTGSARLEAVALPGPFGVEVIGLDLRVEPDGAAQQALARLLAVHHLLVIRQPGVSPSDQKSLMRSFGPLMDEWDDGACFSYSSNVRADTIVPLGRLHWHNDLAWTPSPLWAISLYALEISGPGGPTKFADAVRAHTEIDSDLRAAVDGLSATHVIDVSSGRADLEPARTRRLRPTSRRHQPHVSHPIIVTHPRTLERLLFVNEWQTLSIDDLEEERSDAILDDLYRALYSPANVYEHHWAEGDLVIWDNLAVQHGRDDALADARARRTFTRVVVNDRPNRDLFAGTARPVYAPPTPAEPSR